MCVCPLVLPYCFNYVEWSRIEIHWFHTNINSYRILAAKQPSYSIQAEARNIFRVQFVEMNPLRPFTTAWGSFPRVFPLPRNEKSESFIIFRRVRYLNRFPVQIVVFFFCACTTKGGSKPGTMPSPNRYNTGFVCNRLKFNYQKKKKQHLLDVCHFVTFWAS